MRAYREDLRLGLRSLRMMNSELQRYPVLRDIKRLERETIIRQAGPFNGKAVLLDVGCGLGEDMHAIAGRTGGYLVGIDVNGLALRECRPHPRMGFLEMDASKMAFPDGAFDLSFLTVNTLGNFGLEKRLRLLREMLRVSGCALISLYVNTGNPEEMRIAERLKYYQAIIGSDDVHFDGRRFISDSIELIGRLFTIPEIEEMFRVYGISSYGMTRLNEILLNVRIPSQNTYPEPDFSKIDLIGWDR